MTPTDTTKESTMSDPDTSALRALQAAATTGRWATGEIYGLVAPSKVDGFAFPELRKETVRRVEANTAYIAALVNAAPALLDELDQLREDNAVLSGQVARVEWMLTDAWNGSAPLTFSAVKQALAIPAEGGECGTCGEGDFPQGECPESKRPCGHHCNHVWTHDQCDWCGKHFDAEGGE